MRQKTSFFPNSPLRILRAISTKLWPEKCSFQSASVSAIFVKENWISKKIPEIVDARHLNRTFMTWVKTSLSYILIQSTCGTGKTNFFSQNKPWFVSDALFRTNFGLFWHTKIHFAAQEVIFTIICDKLVFTQVVNVRFLCIWPADSRIFLENKNSLQK